MIKIIYTLFFLLTIGLSFGQNSEVDSRNGFKKIKLGSQYDAFNGIVDFPCKNPKSICGLWKTSDSDLGYLFNEKIDYFELEFDGISRALNVIRINVVIKKPYTDPEVFERYKAIGDNLKFALGKPNKILEDVFGFMWYGEKVAMALILNPQEMKLDENHKTVGLTNITLTFSLINNIKANATNGF